MVILIVWLLFGIGSIFLYDKAYNILSTLIQCEPKLTIVGKIGLVCAGLVSFLVMLFAYECVQDIEKGE